MCNCSKQISQTDCQRLIECVQDSLKRTFIYHIFDDSNGKTRLEIACVQKDLRPNDVAIERGFIDENKIPEWYYVYEHPCIHQT